mgnify:CR=1 FL=1
MSLLKSVLYVAIAAAALCGGTSAAAGNDPGAPLKVLAIGNSFSWDAVEQNLWEIADADGRTLIIGNMYIGGCSLKRHWRNAENDSDAYRYCKIGPDGKKSVRKNVSLSDALADEKWDVVTFQQASGWSGMYETYKPYLGNLIDYVKARVPAGTRFMFHQTWAYERNSAHGQFSNYGRDQKRMFEAIDRASTAACEEFGLDIIPAGTAVQCLRKSEIGNNTTRDGYHLNYLSRYAVSLTWYEALTGRCVKGNSYDAPHVEEWMKQTAQEAAHAAVSAPGKVVRVGPEAHKTLYDEAGVPEYVLPDPLVMADGTPVKTRTRWYGERRPELLALFTEQMYGKTPQAPSDIRYEVVESSDDAMDGKAVRKQINLYPGQNGKKCIHLLVYLPKKHKGPVPVFAGINFMGNWAVSDDPAILLPDKKMRGAYGIVENLERGREKRRWPLDRIISSGFGLVTFYRGDADPDFNDGFRNGLTPLIYRNGQKWPEADQWGSISVWAWALSRVMDYIEKDADLDQSRVAVIGHSRLGKAALWAGACDERFAMVISNCSGAGGAALSRRMYGETLQDLNRHFPHWFCGNFHKYSGREQDLPFDQHELLALVAPRPLYIASADGDRWADPKGEFLAAKAASAVYEFLGCKGLAAWQWPRAGQPSVTGDVAYHLRHGKHDILEYDWDNYIKFASRHFHKGSKQHRRGL